MVRFSVCLFVLLICSGCAFLDPLRDGLNSAFDYVVDNPLPAVSPHTTEGQIDWGLWGTGLAAAAAGGVAGVGSTKLKRKNGSSTG